MKKEYQLTIGLFDKDCEKQLVNLEQAEAILADILINNHQVYAFTMIECAGVYRMQSTGNIVFEPSIRIEIAVDNDEVLNREEVLSIIADIKIALNQETVMMKVFEQADISFI